MKRRSDVPDNPPALPRLSSARRLVASTVAAVVAVVTGLVPVPAPAVANAVTGLLPDLTLVEEVLVDSRDADGSDTLRTLEEGATYRLRVSGTYQYGGGEADAECANLGSKDPRFLPSRFSDTLGPHVLDVKVNGVGVDWNPTVANADGCNVADHTYEFAFSPAATDRVNFAVADLNHRDNMGILRVQIFRSDGPPSGAIQVDAFSVPATSPGGRNSSATLQAGTTYRLVVTNRFSFGLEGATHDAECLRLADAPGQRLDALDEQGQGLDLLVNNAEVDWAAATGVTGCNDEDSTYVHEFIPSITSAVNLRVRDISYGDNFGSLDVTIFEMPSSGSASPPATPIGNLAPTPPPTNFVEEVRVDSRSDIAATTILPLLAGVDYTFIAAGTYEYNGGALADAECANLGSVDPTFQRDRFATMVGPHALDVTFNNVGIEWEPVQANPDGCNTDDHRYRFFHTPTTTAHGRFIVADGNRRDNKGVITIQIYRTEGLPRDGTKVDEFTVSAASAGGRNSNISLTAGTPYRIVAANRFGFGLEGATHDAECLYAVDGIGQRLDAADEQGQGLDALLNGSEIDWISPFGVTGCNDRNFTYYREFVPAVSGRVNIRIRDISYGDNTGGLTVSIYEL